MRRRGHHAAPNHILTERQAQIRHRKAFRTQDLALAAQRTAVDHRVGLMVPLHDRGVVVHLAGVDARVPLVFLHVQTLAHANEAFALQTSSGFGFGLFKRIALAGVFRFQPLQRSQPVERSVQPGRARAFILARCRQGNAGHGTLKRHGGPAAFRRPCDGGARPIR